MWVGFLLCMLFIVLAQLSMFRIQSWKTRSFAYALMLLLLVVQFLFWDWWLWSFTTFLFVQVGLYDKRKSRKSDPHEIERTAGSRAVVWVAVILIVEVIFITGQVPIHLGIAIRNLPRSWAQSVALVFTHAVVAMLSIYLSRLEVKVESNRQEELADLMRRNELVRQKAELETSFSASKELLLMTERNRISREIHDSVGHSLSTIVIQLRAISAMTKTSHPDVSEMTDELGRFSQQSLQDIRQVIADLKPRDLEKYNLDLLIAGLLDEAESKARLNTVWIKNQPMWQLSEEQSLALYRSVQEFLTNTIKHAKAKTVRVTLHFTEEQAILTMQDDGVGVLKIVPHVGLSGMQERLRELGGTMTSTSAPGEGFQTRIELPKQHRLTGGIT